MADEVIASIEKSMSVFYNDGTQSRGLRAVLSHSDWRTGSSLYAWGMKRGASDDVIMSAVQYTYDGINKTYQSNEFGYAKMVGSTQYQVTAQDSNSGHNISLGISPNDDVVVDSIDSNINDSHNMLMGKNAGGNPGTSFSNSTMVAHGPYSLFETTGIIAESVVEGAYSGYKINGLTRSFVYGNRAGYTAKTGGSVGLAGYEAGMNGDLTNGISQGRESAKLAVITEFSGYGNYALSGASCSGVDAFGYQSGLNNTGDSSAFFCAGAGKNNTGAACLHIGRATGEGNTYDNQLLIGHGVTHTGSSNVVVLGKIGDHNNTLLPGVSKASGGSIANLSGPSPLYITDSGEIFANDNV